MGQWQWVRAETAVKNATHRHGGGLRRPLMRNQFERDPFGVEIAGYIHDILPSATMVGQAKQFVCQR
jgi:hypothetical protein